MPNTNPTKPITSVTIKMLPSAIEIHSILTWFCLVVAEEMFFYEGGRQQIEVGLDRLYIEEKGEELFIV